MSFDYDKHGFSGAKRELLKYYGRRVVNLVKHGGHPVSIGEFLYRLSKEIQPNSLFMDWMSEEIPDMSLDTMNDFIKNRNDVIEVLYQYFPSPRLFEIWSTAFLESSDKAREIFDIFMNRDNLQNLDTIKRLEKLYKGLYITNFMDMKVYLVAYVTHHDQFSTLLVPDSFVKVGIPSNLKKRMDQIQNSSGRRIVLLASIDRYHREDAIMIEREIHKVLNEYRTKGEWFKCDPVLAVSLFDALGGNLENNWIIKENLPI